MKPLIEIENPRINQTQTIKNKIFAIRRQQVMLDLDLVKLYQLETSVLNQAANKIKLFVNTYFELDFLMSNTINLGTTFFDIFLCG